MDVTGNELSPRLLWLLMLISGSTIHIVRVNVTLETIVRNCFKLLEITGNRWKSLEIVENC